MTQEKHFHGGRIEITQVGQQNHARPDYATFYPVAPEPIAALAGNFPHLEPAGPPSNGTPIAVTGLKRCPGCETYKPNAAFRYNNDCHSKGAARCDECRGKVPNGQSAREVTQGINLQVYPSMSSTSQWPEKRR